MDTLHVALRDAMVRDTLGEGGSTVDALHGLGVLAVELDLRADGSLPMLQEGKITFSLSNESQLAATRDLLQQAKIRVCAILLGTDFAADDPRPSIDWTLRAIATAEALGAPAVRIDVTHRRDIPVQEIQKRFLDGIASIFKQTASSRIDLGIENHGAISNDPAFLDAVFAAEPNSRIGLTLDTGNFYWYGLPIDELYALVEHFAPRVRHTHIKTINYPPDIARQRRTMGFEYGKYCSPLDEGNIDLPRIVRILHAAGHRRGLCIENEALRKYPAEERMKVLQRDVAAVQSAIAKLSPA